MTQEALKQMYQLLLTEPHAPTVCAQLERIAREALAEHAMQQRLGREILQEPLEICKYGQEPASCTSNPMDCQCAIDAALAQPEQEPKIGCVNHDCDQCKAQPEQEPVAWIHNFIEGGISIGKRPADLERHPDRWTALYKEPKPCPTCEALARTVMLDQTSHDTTPPQRTERNFCERCGKRTKDIHTCTPPQENT